MLETVNAPRASTAAEWTTVGLGGNGGPAPGTLIRATDIQTLMDQIDADLEAAGLPDFPWTDSIVSNAVTIKAVQFAEMRTAIGVLYARKGLTLPDWTDEAPGGPSVGTPATPCRASHLTDLQGWLATYEATPPPFASQASNLGLNVATYRPQDTPQPTLPDDTFALDISQLGVRYVRVEVIADANGISPAVVSSLGQWLGVLTSDPYNLIPILVLTNQTFGGSPFDWNEPPQPDASAPPGPQGQQPLMNPWVYQSARRANFIASQFPNVSIFEIWNEPNGEKTALDAGIFASLLNYCAQFMRYGIYPNDPVQPPLEGAPSVQTICSGGILMQDSSGPPCSAFDPGYVSGIYTDATTQYWQSMYTGTFPWDHFGIHPYVTANVDPQNPCSGMMVYWIKSIAGLVQSYNDTNALWATEFGTPRLTCDELGTCEGCENQNPATSDQPAVDQSNILQDIFQALVAQCMPTPVGLACWFKHEAVNPDNQGWFGLTSFCYAAGPPGSGITYLTINGPSTQHWLAWSSFKAQLVG